MQLALRHTPLRWPSKRHRRAGARIYTGIARIASVMPSKKTLRFGCTYFRQIGDGHSFGFPYGTTYTLAFSRMLYNHEVLVAYNVAPSRRRDCIVADSTLHSPGDKMTFRYGDNGSVQVEWALDGTHFLQLDLDGQQFVILE
jgi:hypothetical protein